MRFAITIILSACLCTMASAQEMTDTVREVPPDGEASPDVTARYHPDYKKLLDEVQRLEAALEGADDESAAWLRQRYDAAAARLFAYIDSGKPTILAVDEPAANKPDRPSPTPNPGLSVTPSSRGTGGKRRTTVPECAVVFDFYEEILSEGLVFTGVKSVDIDSGEYALEWQGDAFSVQLSVTEVSDLIEGGWRRDDVSITGRLSATGDRLESLTFEHEEYFEGEGATPIVDGHRVTLSDLPLRQVKQAGVFDVFEYEINGGYAIEPHVRRFIRVTNDGESTGGLRLDVAGDERVVMNIRREPRIYVKVMKSKL